ncbi:G-protein coupled receptor-associated protein LMBRD2-like [Ptychodera flava]|uniref:G-protein coupled receptor-associated protein LMBRD2-like n=1 Tax=Ptychodera flava TaxID=63121 RepID=UPI00396A0FAF
MSVGPLAVEIICVFILSAYLLHRYSNWRKQHIVVTLATFVSWYFSFIIIFILPLDVSSTIYQQCIYDHEKTDEITTLSSINESHQAEFRDSFRDDNSSFMPIIGNFSITTNRPNGAPTTENSTETTELTSIKRRDVYECGKPWSYVPDTILPDMWNIVYWTSQILTWIVCPLMQSYSRAGEFTVRGKLKSALIENAIYYGSYLLIFGILLIYVAARPDIRLDGAKLSIILVTASNTWGLFLLVLLLGYGLVEVPRKYWNAAKKGYELSYTYFQIAKLSTEKSEAEENLEDILDEIKKAAESIRYNHPLHKHIDTIMTKCPEDFQDKVGKRTMDDYEDYGSGELEMPTQRTLVKLHSKVIYAVMTERRTQFEWHRLLERAFELEDVEKNAEDGEGYFKHTFSSNPRKGLLKAIYTPKLEWYWKIVFKPWTLKFFAIILAIFSLAVIWSEVTFFNKNPVLSLFAIFVDLAAANYNYFYIELASFLTIAYMSVCAYYPVFKIRVFNYYYLADHHQTDENSLLFSAILLCRLTPPLCLNFLGLIHLDSHITGDEDMLETSFTAAMGRHMDVLPFMADGFYIYYPITVLVLCIATYFSLGSRCLAFLGFQQFIGEDEMTQDYVDEGRQIVKREKRKRQRIEDGETRRREFFDRYGTRDAGYSSGGYSSSEGGRYGRARESDSDTGRIASSYDTTRAKFIRNAKPPDSDKVELLKETEPIDFNEDHVTDYTDSLSLNADRNGVSGSGRYNRPSWNNTRTSSYSSRGAPKRGFFDDI